MLEQAHAFGFRIILPNRRLYPGSTPYTAAEASEFQEGLPVETHQRALLKQGEYLLLFLSNIIASHQLQHVLLVGWSLGSTFLNAAVASINTVPEELKSSVRTAVKSIILWDPPSQTHGIPNPPTGGWTPLYDLSLTPEERGQAFGIWVAQYYQHKDLDKKDYNGLVYRLSEPIKPGTFTGVPFEELLTKLDLTAGANGDNMVVAEYFQPALFRVLDQAIFNQSVREAWENVPITVIYGEETLYNVHWAVWKIEELAEQKGLPVRTIKLPGANHFAMEDHTDLAFETLKRCIAVPRYSIN